jgi:hypothetical protein
MLNILTQEEIDEMLDARVKDEFGIPFTDDVVPSIEVAMVKLVDAIRVAEKTGLKIHIEIKYETMNKEST